MSYLGTEALDLLVTETGIELVTEDQSFLTADCTYIYSFQGIGGVLGGVPVGGEVFAYQNTRVKSITARKVP